VTNLFIKFTSRARAVRSIDFIMTFDFAVRGEFASLNGLKLRTVEIILLAITGRERMSVPKEFNVAVTSNASLYTVRFVP
jgi:hypothetical protein